MAKNIKEVRDTIGINDGGISVAAYEPKIIVIELGKYKLDSTTNYSKKDINSNEITEGMAVQVASGGNPNKNREEMDK